MHNIPTIPELRVFISSTFKDLDEERTLLMTRVFPQLIKLASLRGVNLVPIDLRWGITNTSEEKDIYNTKIIDVCLKEIDAAQCFIGIVGDRYGWCPSLEELSKSNMLKGDYARLVNAGMSMTEIEMQYGVLARQKHSFTSFFIKKTDSTDESHEPLNALRKKINHYEGEKCTLCEFSSLQELAKNVEISIQKVLDSLFPEIEMSEYQRMKYTQQNIIGRYNICYIAKEKLFKEIDTGLAEHQCVCITGLSGVGKSALLANWITRYINDESRHVFYYFPNGKSDCDYQNILKFLCNEIANTYNLPIETKRLETPYSLLQSLLKSIKQEFSIILAIDGVNENWISFRRGFQFPSNVKLLFTCHLFDGNSLWADNMDYPSVVIDQMDKEERHTFIELYLRHKGKELEKERIEYLAGVFTGNITMLRTLLDTIITFGKFDTIKHFIEDFIFSKEGYCSSSKYNPELIFFDEHQKREHYEDSRFYHALLNLYETSYPEMPIMDIIASIQLVPLRESEIADFVDTTPLYWANVKALLGDLLYKNKGFITINDAELQSAIEERYEDRKRYIYERAMNYFEKIDSPRKHIIRLRYCTLMEDYESLSTSLCDISLFKFMNAYSREDLAYYWNKTITHFSEDNILKRFAQKLISEQFITNDHLDILCDFCRFCIYWMGNGEVALIVANKAYSECKSLKGETHILTLYAAYHAAMSRILTGDNKGAIDIMIKEGISEMINGLAECHMIKGLALALMHQYKDSHLAFYIAKTFIADIYGERSWMMARCLLYEGISYLLDHHHNKKAIIILEKAQSIVYNEYGVFNLLYADISLALATYFCQVGKIKEAFLGWTHAYSEYTSKLHEKNLRIAVADIIAGKISLCAKQYEDANDYFENANEILRINNISVEEQKVIEGILDVVFFQK